MADVQRRVAVSWLVEFYGALLTEHRRSIMQMYCDEDLSLGEIALQMGITRQAASDALNRSIRQLEGYEEKLGLVARYRALTDEARRCKDILGDAGGLDAKRAGQVRACLNNILKLEG